jgi:hypothetical protein
MNCTISVTANGRSRPIDPLIGSYGVGHLYLHTILGQIDQCMGMKTYLHSPLLDTSDLPITFQLPRVTPSTTLLCRACAFAYPVLLVNRTWQRGYFQWETGEISTRSPLLVYQGRKRSPIPVSSQALFAYYQWPDHWTTSREKDLELALSPKALSLVADASRPIAISITGQCKAMGTPSFEQVKQK